MGTASRALRYYAGRWVALIQDRVAGTGLTADEARLAAQLSRPKEQATVIYVPEFPPLELPEIVSDIRAALPADLPAWLVGGAVRDTLLNRRVRDLDFVVDGDAVRAARRVADALGADVYPLDAERDVGRVIYARETVRYTIDFARLREGSLAGDLAKRDFTVNAMAVPLAEPDTLIDPLGGEADLKAKLIRACSPAAIADDALRGVRAVRLAAQLRMRLDRQTREDIRAHAHQLADVSPERRRDEFIRCVGGSKPAAALRALDLLGLLPHLLPEMCDLKGLAQSPPHTLDAWEHSLAVVTRLAEVLAVLAPTYDMDAASDLTLGLISVQMGRHRQILGEHLEQSLAGDRPARWLLMLAAALHDAGKVVTQEIEPSGRIRFLGHEAVSGEIVERSLARLRFGGDEIKRARTVAAQHMRPRQISKRGGQVSRRAIYRYFRDTGAAGVDIVLLSLADYLGKFGAGPPPQDEWAQHVDVCAQLLRAYFERPEEAVAPPALVNGHDLMQAFGLEAGPRIGRLLETVREAQAAGEVADREAALALVKRRLEDEEKPAG